MRLREPMEELIRAHESTRDMLPKKNIQYNMRDPKDREAKAKASEAKEKATEKFLALIKEGKYFAPHQDMAFYNSWSRLQKLDEAFNKEPGYKPNRSELDFILIQNPFGQFYLEKSSKILKKCKAWLEHRVTPIFASAQLNQIMEVDEADEGAASKKKP